MSKLIITEWKGQILTALWNGKKITRLQLDDLQPGRRVGDVLVGRVDKVNPNIQAAFVKAGDDQVLYYPYRADQKPKAGQELLLQLIKEPVKTKAAVVTDEISLAGRYLVLIKGKKGVSVSRKIEDPARRKALALLLQPCCQEYGCILRTNGEHAEDAELLNELASLKGKMKELETVWKHRTIGSVLYRSPSPYVSSLRDLPLGELAEIVTDSPERYEEIKEYLQQNQPEDLDKLKLYQDTVALSVLYNLETVMNRALDKRVWLKSGGYLVIEPTEALVVIDVNTGKYDGHKNFEDTIYKINCEAAEEIAAQLQLRNLSGIIVIDFINMKSRERREELLKVLEEASAGDFMKVTVVGMSQLNLVEMTRKKVRKPLYEQLTAREEKIKELT